MVTQSEIDAAYAYTSGQSKELNLGGKDYSSQFTPQAKDQTRQVTTKVSEPVKQTTSYESYTPEERRLLSEYQTKKQSSQVIYTGEEQGMINRYKSKSTEYTPEESQLLSQYKEQRLITLPTRMSEIRSELPEYETESKKLVEQKKNIEFSAQQIQENQALLEYKQKQFETKYKDNYDSKTGKYVFGNEEQLLQAQKESKDISTLAQETKSKYEKEIVPYNEAVKEYESKYADLRSDLALYSKEDTALRQKAEELQSKYDSTLWFKPENEKTLEEYRKTVNRINLLQGQPEAYTELNKYEENVAKLSSLSLLKGENIANLGLDVVSLGTFGLSNLVLGRNNEYFNKLSPAAGAFTEIATQEFSTLTEQKKQFTDKLGIPSIIAGYSYPEIVSGIRTAYGVGKKAQEKTQELTFKYTPTIFKPLTKYGQDVGKLTTEYVVEPIGKSILENPMGATALVTTSALSGGLLGGSATAAIKGVETLKYIPISMGFQTIGTKVVSDIATPSAQGIVSGVGVSQIEEIRQKATMGEYIETSKSQSKLVNALSQAPILDFFFRNRKAYSDIVSEEVNKLNISEPEKEKVKKYLGRQGEIAMGIKDISQGIVLAEVGSELAGRSLFSKSVATKPLDITSKSFKKSFTMGYKTIGQVAPIEVFSTIGGQSSYYGENLNLGSLAAQNVALSQFAGVTGGAIIGFTSKAIAKKYVPGETKQIKAPTWKENKLGTFIEQGAMFSEYGYEHLGDFMANVYQKGFKITDQNAIYGISGKKLRIVTPINVQATTPVNVATKQYTSSKVPLEMYDLADISSNAPVLTQNKVQTDLKAASQAMNKVNSLFQLKTQPKTSVYTESKVQSDVLSQTNVNTKLSSNIPTLSDINIGTKIGTKVPISSKINLPTLSNLPVKTDIKLQTPTDITSKIQTKVNIVVSDKPAQGLPFIPYLGGMGGFGFGSRTKQKKAYIPSFDAIFFNIRAKKSKYKKKSIYTGFELRPILD